MRPSLYIVEDDAHMMVGLVRALGHPSCRFSFVGASGDAESALTAVDFGVDLFITDYRLEGGTDGIELTSRIKQQGPPRASAWTISC
ncbi:MAG: response regulator [Limisphaerales bacterium]